MNANKIFPFFLCVFTMSGIVAQSFNLENVDAQLSQIHDDDQRIRKTLMDAFQKNYQPLLSYQK